MVKSRVRLGMNAKKQFAQLGRQPKMRLNNTEIKLEYVDVKFKDQAEADKFLNSVECKHFMEVEKAVVVDKKISSIKTKKKKK